MMSKRKKWQIVTIAVLAYMFLVWLFTPEGAPDGWFKDEGKDNLVIAFFDIPIIFVYLIFSISLYFSKNQPFLPQKGTIVEQTKSALISVPIIALIVLCVLLILPQIL